MTGRSPGRTVLASMLAVLTMLGITFIAQPASAAPPAYQITGQWASGTPATTASGKLVTAVWRVNVNDSANPPANDDVDNVNFSVTVQHGRFTEIPSPCKTAGVAPRSSISADGATLVCNLGTVKEGTAEVVQAPMTVSGQTGDKISATGTIDGQTADVPPIPISGTFGEDMLWGTPSAYQLKTQPLTPTNAEFDLEWTLRTKPGSDPGPNSVTYNLTITQNPSSGPQRTLVAGASDSKKAGCTAFSIGQAAAGHPWSGRPNTGAENAPFVTTCTLTKVDNTHFRLTLTGIDYSKTTLPSKDSTGAALPTNWDAVASGSIWLTLHGMTAATGITLTASSPTYRSTTGQTFTDAASNNKSTKALTLPGDWSTSWARGFTHSGGSNWDNSYQVPQGTVVESQVTDYYGRESAIPNNSVIAECDILDRKYVTFNGTVQTVKYPPAGGTLTPFPATIWYYTGTGDAARAKYLLPNNAAYDPNAFRGCSGNTGWTTTKPPNGQVLAVRATWPKSRVAGMYARLLVQVTVASNAPIGQDVWTWAATRKGSTATWNYPGRQTTSGITPVPGSRYHYTNQARDVLHVTGPTPIISKSANPKVVTPGVPATFTLHYQMKGRAGLKFNNVKIVDTLPAGMTYVAGSAKPAPTSVSGRTLTWVLNQVPSNTQQTITYQASVAGVAAGKAVTNNVTMTYGNQSAKAAAQVTVATSGYTSILKTSDLQYIPNLKGDGSGSDAWTVTLTSNDPLPQPYTDTIDILPYNGDGRGTSFSGTYTIGQISPPAGATVYYTTADSSTLSDDPYDRSNGTSPGSIAGNTVQWSTTYSPNATAIRVIGPQLAPGATQQFKVPITTANAHSGDVYVNRAQAADGHTELVMRTSAKITMAPYYAATLKKYVQDVNGKWHDANGPADYPAFHYGDTIHYRVVVTNVGEGTLTNIDVSDDKQPQLGAFHIDSLASGKSQSHEYSITLDTSTTGTVVNNACAKADTPPDATSAPDIPCDPAGFTVTNYITKKTADPAAGTPVQPGQVIHYTITVTQQGPAPADAQFSDDLSKVLDDADYNGDVTASIGSAKADLDAKTIAWTGTIPVGEVATVTYSVTVHSAAELDKSGDTDLYNPVTSPGCVPKDGEFPDCTTDHKTGYYKYSKVVDPKSGSTVSVGDKVSYTVTVVQHGKAAVPDATVNDDLSKVLDDATYDNDAKSSSGSVSYAAPKLTWEGDLAVGAKVTITYSVTVTGKGDQKLANVVTSPDKRGSCDETIGCMTHHQVPSYRVKKTASAAKAQPGDKVTYTITVTNTGQADYTTDAPASFTDDLSKVLDDATYDNDATNGATYNSPVLSWSGPLAMGTSVTITYSVTINKPDQGDGTLHNVVVTPPNDGGKSAGGNCPIGSSNPDCATTTGVGAAPAPPLQTIDTGNAGSSNGTPTGDLLAIIGATLLALAGAGMIGLRLRRRTSN